jgi:[acyl-carrier-protein] S-malonyltransferase
VVALHGAQLISLFNTMKPFAFVFPGQGSQSIGMLDAWGDHPVIKETLTEASDALGEDIGKLIQQGPKEQLDLTTHTQPAMLTAAIACYRVWLAEGGSTPTIVAGHSLGEYTALVASEALTLTQAAPLVRLRAQAMQEAVPVGQGAMAAILGLDAQAVISGCQQISTSQEMVEAVNFNDPKQTVIAGTRAGVDAACEYLKQQGAKRALLLPVSAPFHSRLMQPAAEQLREALEKIALQSPKIKVINNIDVNDPTDPNAIKDALYRQAFGPVRWTEVIMKIRNSGLSYILECGPGKALSGMVKRIDAELQTMTLSDPTTLAQAQELLA